MQVAVADWKSGEMLHAIFLIVSCLNEDVNPPSVKDRGFKYDWKLVISPKGNLQYATVFNTGNDGESQSADSVMGKTNSKFFFVVNHLSIKHSEIEVDCPGIVELFRVSTYFWLPRPSVWSPVYRDIETIQPGLPQSFWQSFLISNQQRSFEVNFRRDNQRVTLSWLISLCLPSNFVNHVELWVNQ